MTSVYFHIGLHKTGTTFLQKEYFPKLSVHYVRGSLPFYKVIGELSSNKGVVLVSDENLSGQLFSGRKYLQCKETMSAIKKAFPDAKIIIGFRNHLDFIVSSYKQLLHQGGIVGFHEFYKIDNTGLLKNEDLCYKNIIELLNNNFKDVCIYTIDEIKDMPVFDKKISKFLGLENCEVEVNEKKVNKSVRSQAQVNTLLKLNRLDRKIENVFGFKVLYNKLFKFLKITPRNICQYYMSDKGKVFSLDKDFQDEVKLKFKNDWNYLINVKSVENK